MFDLKKESNMLQMVKFLIKNSSKKKTLQHREKWMLQPQNECKIVLIVKYSSISLFLWLQYNSYYVISHM